MEQVNQACSFACLVVLTLGSYRDIIITLNRKGVNNT